MKQTKKIDVCRNRNVETLKDSNNVKRYTGFTLVELIVTLSIVVILTMVSYPIYRTNREDAKLAEGYALLGLIVDKQKNYYNEYGTFLSSSKSSYQNTSGGVHSSQEDVLGIYAANNRYFTSFSIAANGIVDYENTFTASVKCCLNKKETTLSLYYNRFKHYDIVKSVVNVD